MQQYLLLAPVLLPLLGGLPVFKMNERIPRRRYVTVLLVLELAALLVINWHAGAVLPVLQLWGGARVVLGADALGRLFALLVAALWLVVSVFADEYMTHEHVNLILLILLILLPKIYVQGYVLSSYRLEFC